jgi:hypothetical protein
VGKYKEKREENTVYFFIEITVRLSREVQAHVFGQFNTVFFAGQKSIV